MIPPYSYRVDARRRRKKRLTRTLAVGVALLVFLIFVVPHLFGGGGKVTTAGSPTPGASLQPSVAVSPSPSPAPSPAASPPALKIAALAKSLPAALSRAQALPDGTTLLILGGLAGGNSSNLVQRFDPVSGTVVPAGHLAVGTHDAAAAALGSTAYLFGGGEATTIDTVQALSGAASTVVGHLPQARSDLEAVALGGKIYLLGGYDGKTDQADVLSTVDGVHFQFLARLPTPVRYAGLAVVGSTIYLVGGEHNGSQTTQIQAIDTVNATAKVVANMQVPLSHECVFTLGGAVFVAGGRSGATTRNQVDSLDPTTGALTRAGLLPQSVADATLGQIGPDVYLFGGESPTPLKSIIHISFTAG